MSGKNQKDLFGNVPIGSYKPFSDRQIKSFKKDLYIRLRKYLEDTGNYNQIDDDLISVYIQSISDIRRYSLIIEKEGELIPNGGNWANHPLLRLKQKSIDNSTKIADKLGILSVNRNKLDQVQEDSKNENPFMEFMQ